MKNPIDELMYRAEKFMEQNKWMHAIQLYDRILDEDETFLPAYHAVAEHYMNQGQFQIAEDYLLDAYDAVAQDEKTQFLLGNLNLMQNKSAEALQWYTQIERNGHVFAELTYNMGLAKMRLGLAEEALDYFNKTIDLSPDFPRIHEIMGDLYLHLNRLEDAEIHLAEAVRNDPMNPHCHVLLGNVYLTKNLPKKALSYLKKARDLDDEDLSALHGLGMATFNSGKREEGVKLLEEVVGNEPGNMRFRFDLGMCYFSMQQYDKARVELEYVKKMAPNNSWVNQTLKQLKQLERIMKHTSVQRF